MGRGGEGLEGGVARYIHVCVRMLRGCTLTGLLLMIRNVLVTESDSPISPNSSESANSSGLSSLYYTKGRGVAG